MAINPITDSVNKVSALTYDGEPSISLTLADAANQKTEAKVGEVVFRSNAFNVKLTDSQQYSVSIQAANGYDSNLRNGNSIIRGVGDNIKPEDFSDNTWGYALTETASTEEEYKQLEYSTIPENTGEFVGKFESVEDTNGAVDKTIDKTFRVIFAAKFGGDSPSGDYTSQVYISAVANPIIVNQLGVTTMQELTGTICKNLEPGTTDRLEDTRDRKNNVAGTGSYYWVTRLSDGNCWMTQNLDYNPPSPTTEANPSNWTDSGASKNTYYDPDKGSSQYYYYTNGAGTDDEGKDVGACTTSKDVDALKKCTGFAQQTPDLKTEDGLKQEHYRVGNYYSWQAAQSVCPTNGAAQWKLPTSNSTTENGSFGKMLTGYNIASSVADGTSAAIYADPVYFVYGGYVDSSGLINAGGSGYYWSSTPYGSDSAYRLDFNSSSVSSSNGNGRYRGLSVRCLVIGS